MVAKDDGGQLFDSLYRLKTNIHDETCRDLTPSRTGVLRIALIAHIQWQQVRPDAIRSVNGHIVGSCEKGNAPWGKFFSRSVWDLKLSIRHYPRGGRRQIP